MEGYGLGATRLTSDAAHGSIGYMSSKWAMGGEQSAISHHNNGIDRTLSESEKYEIVVLSEDHKPRLADLISREGSRSTGRKRAETF